MDCLNLKKEFGDKYRVVYEESYYAEYGPHARVEDPWLMIIPCRNGHICPWGGRFLAACTNNLGPVANPLMALPFARTSQIGDGANIHFDAEHFEEVARIMKPRKLRWLSPEEQTKRTRRLRAYWGHVTSRSSEAVAGPRAGL
jgi:hypothetical protein